MPECLNTADTPELPSAPLGLIANGTADSVQLDWTENPADELVTSYKVYRATSRGGPFTLLDTVTTTNYEDSTATAGVLYWYRVIAANANGDGPYSDVSGSWLADATAPGNVTITSTTVVGTTNVTVTWTPPTDSDLAGFKVYARISPTAYALVSGAALLTNPTFTHNSATAGNTWDYKVTSLDFTGNESTGSTTSIAVPASDTTAPAAPSGVTATGTTSGITVAWTPNTESDLAGYNIFRSDDGYVTALNGGTPVATSPTSYNDTTAVVATPYTYKVDAEDATGNTSSKSSASNSASRLADSGVESLTDFVKVGTMAPCGGWARGVSYMKYFRAEGGDTVVLTQNNDFLALTAGTVLTTKYDWNMAAGTNNPQGSFPNLRGFNAAHYYDQPGNYKIRLDRTDSAGNFKRFEHNFNLAADTRRKVYVASNGSGSTSNDGSSSSSPVNPSRANQIISETSNAKIVLKQGDTFVCNTTLFTVKTANIWITTESGFGDSTIGRPVFVWTTTNGGSVRVAIEITSAASNTIIEQIRVNQTWSATGPEKNKDYFVRTASLNGTVVRDIKIKSCGEIVATAGGGTTRYVLVQNIQFEELESLRAYLMYTKGEDIVILGCTVPDSKGEHPVRILNGNRVLIAFCNFTNNTASGVVAKQPIQFQEGTYAYLYNNTFSATQYQDDPYLKYAEFGPLSETTGTPSAYLQYGVIDRNLFNCRLRIKAGLRDVLFRNNIVISNGANALEIIPQVFATTSAGSLSAKRMIRVYMYNNTVINTGTAGTRENLKTSQAVLETFEFKNNLCLGASYTNNGSTHNINIVLNSSNLPGTSVSFDRNSWPTLDRFKLNSTVETVAFFNQRSFVGTDMVENPTLNSEYKLPSSSAADTFGRPVSGVYEDFYGTARDRNAVSWCVGAVEGTY